MVPSRGCGEALLTPGGRPHPERAVPVRSPAAVSCVSGRRGAARCGCPGGRNRHAEPEIAAGNGPPGRRNARTCRLHGRSGRYLASGKDVTGVSRAQSTWLGIAFSVRAGGWRACAFLLGRSAQNHADPPGRGRNRRGRRVSAVRERWARSLPGSRLAQGDCRHRFRPGDHRSSGAARHHVGRMAARLTAARHPARAWRRSLRRPRRGRSIGWRVDEVPVRPAAARHPARQFRTRNAAG